MITDITRRPITVRTAREIGHEARRRRTVRGLIFAGKAVAIAVGFIVLVVLWSCV